MNRTQYIECISEFGFNSNKLRNFNQEELKYIYNFARIGVNVIDPVSDGDYDLAESMEGIIMSSVKYESYGYGYKMDQEIRFGNAIGVNILKYIDPTIYSTEQVRQIILGIKCDPNITKYPLHNFSPNQLEQIRLGASKGFDVSVYTDPNISFDKMKIIRKNIESASMLISKLTKTDLQKMSVEELKSYLSGKTTINLFKLGFDRNTADFIYNIGDEYPAIVKYINPNMSTTAIRLVQLAIKNNQDPSMFSKFNNLNYNIHQVIEIAKGFKHKVDVSWYIDPRFTADQMRIIRNGLESHFDVSIYANVEFDNSKMQEIFDGLFQGFDVSWYANPEYTLEQMKEIKKGIKGRVDVSIYAKPEYTAAQMKQIRLGLKKKINVSLYANKDICAKDMKKIRLELVANNQDKEKPNVLIDCLENDISLYANKKFNADQMNEMELGSKSNINVKCYADVRFSAKQMAIIRAGFEEGFDASKYADYNLPVDRMSRILALMKNGKNISFYCDPKYSTCQCDVLNRFINKGVNVSAFSDPKYSSEKMKFIGNCIMKYKVDITPYINPQTNLNTMKNIFELLRKSK